MRCPECAKFVSQEAGDIDVDESIDDEGNISVDVRIVQQCADCGTPLKEASFTLEYAFDDEVGEHDTEKPDEHGDYDLDVELDNAEWSKGSGRYRETFYGVAGTITATCKCGVKAEIAIECSENGNPDAYVPASGMDEC